MIELRNLLGLAGLVIERCEGSSATVPWWASTGAFGSTGAVLGGIAWAIAWLRFEGTNSRLDIGRWIAGGTVLGGFAGILHLFQNSGLL